MFDLEETIAALASPPGAGVRSIVRISGDSVRDVLAPVFRPDDPRRWQRERLAWRHPGRLTLAEFPEIPVAVALWPTSRSYTGSPMAEVHAPGAPLLAEAIQEALFRAGARPAKAGEFTLRAFLAGRIDLPQAEAVLGVIDAEDHQELALALGQLAGGLSNRIAQLRGDLLSLLADLEAGLDFVEEDISFISREEVRQRVVAARETLEELYSQARGRLRDSPTARIVLAGLPNAGKSTLFNRLVGREAALVSVVPGTTRDWLTSVVDWEGIRIELVDTAGWETPRDELTRAMDALRRNQLERADLVVWCHAVEGDSAAEFSSPRELLGERTLVISILTKADLWDRSCHDDDAKLAISSHSGQGLAALRTRCLAALFQRGEGQREAAGGRLMLGSTGARGRESLAAATEALERLEEAADGGLGDEILSVELRLALDGLGQVVGAVYTDDVLDLIFSRFCIGK